MILFYQAEDGIRDYKVTGVQTCALPISSRQPAATGTVGRASTIAATRCPRRRLGRVTCRASRRARPGSCPACVGRGPHQIGRASCSENEWVKLDADCVNRDGRFEEKKEK